MHPPVARDSHTARDSLGSGSAAGAPDADPVAHRANAGRSVARVVSEGLLLLLAIALVTRLGARGIPAALARDSLPALALAVLLGVAFADFASGVIHWLCDTFFSERTPIIGRALILPFRAHHVDPGSILRHGLLELHGNSAVPVVLVLGAVALLPFEPAGPAGDFARVWLFAAAVATLLTNQVHRWAHTEAPPAPVRWLQRSGVILSPERHARHHRGGFDRSFCITTGWLNPLLDRTRLFPRLERRLRARARNP